MRGDVLARGGSRRRVGGRREVRLEIASLIGESLDRARAEVLSPGDSAEVHRARSRAWIRALATAFRRHYAGDRAIRVLTLDDASNRAEFGRNELLYDITVVRVATVRAAVRPVDLTYVREVLWQIESEFARNSREALFDFNKLVLGSARNKL